MTPLGLTDQIHDSMQFTVNASPASSGCRADTDPIQTE
jgi:hypothetical protein